MTACGLGTEGPVFFWEGGRGDDTVGGLLPPLPVCDLQWSKIECQRQLGSGLSELRGLGSARLGSSIVWKRVPEGS